MNSIITSGRTTTRFVQVDGLACIKDFFEKPLGTEGLNPDKESIFYVTDEMGRCLFDLARDGTVRTNLLPGALS
ncbi:hypothetical protein NYS48_09795 [Curtobacterium flaccumfaciens pv. flaccumfaciens]|uniref:hypothetical protein n=1 Tax=Curtobacterium poinsettiae TaxID=159612 RepID=UPI00217E3FFD|nr:hypothetical protein [Curtobacterium flaccumfaciens]MCS6565605.1 hypothetical protein [Curtobacterium flaccumfaciens pv. flaccumfaciens]